MIIIIIININTDSTSTTKGKLKQQHLWYLYIINLDSGYRIMLLTINYICIILLTVK